MIALRPVIVKQAAIGKHLKINLELKKKSYELEEAIDTSVLQLSIRWVLGNVFLNLIVWGKQLVVTAAFPIAKGFERIQDYSQLHHTDFVCISDEAAD